MAVTVVSVIGPRHLAAHRLLRGNDPVLSVIGAIPGGRAVRRVGVSGLIASRVVFMRVSGGRQQPVVTGVDCVLRMRDVCGRVRLIDGAVAPTIETVSLLEAIGLRAVQLFSYRLQAVERIVIIRLHEIVIVATVRGGI